MRRNVRRLNREVGSLNASQAAAKRKATGTVTKGGKKAKEGDDELNLMDEDDFSLPKMMHASSSSAASAGEGNSYARYFYIINIVIDYSLIGRRLYNIIYS